MANIHQCTNPHCPDRPGGIRDRLVKKLREASLPDLNNKRNRFIPRNELIRLVDKKAVSQLLQLSDPSLEEGTTQETVNRICTKQGQCGCGRHWCTGARILFVALALLASERQILRLFDKYKSPDQLCDSNPHPESLADSPNPEREVLTDWPKEKRELFVQLQWQMRSPYFGYLSEDRPVEFCGSISLPWIQRGEHREERSGGFSTVRRIKVHPDHHNMKTNNGYFALKTLHDRAQDHFDSEFNAYRRITNPHDHITPLLTAFHHGNARYLVFPWADGGNLRELFEKEPAEIEVWCNAEWVWKACLGISEGLHHMHQPPHAQAPREGPSVLNVSPPSQQRDGVSRGEENENESEIQIEKTSAPQLHADIKPENILCFSTVTAPNDSGSRGGPYTLRLADLGLAKPISEPSGVKSKDIKQRLTYRPPEQELDAEFATQQWDIWALGCLFLELMIWFLEGPSSLEEFMNERQDDVDSPRASGGGSRVFEDSFFRIRVKNRITSRFPRVEVRKKANVKECVIARIHTVKEKSRCTDSLRRLLGFIEENMLVVDPTKRATTEKVVKLFRGQSC